MVHCNAGDGQSVPTGPNTELNPSCPMLYLIRVPVVSSHSPFRHGESNWSTISSHALKRIFGVPKRLSNVPKRFSNVPKWYTMCLVIDHSQDICISELLFYFERTIYKSK